MKKIIRNMRNIMSMGDINEYMNMSPEASRIMITNIMR